MKYGLYNSDNYLDLTKDQLYQQYTFFLSQASTPFNNQTTREDLTNHGNALKYVYDHYNELHPATTTTPTNTMTPTTTATQTYDPKSFLSASKETLVATYASYTAKYGNTLDTNPSLKNYLTAMKYAIEHYNELKPVVTTPGTTTTTATQHTTPILKYILLGGLALVVIGMLGRK